MAAADSFRGCVRSRRLKKFIKKIRGMLSYESALRKNKLFGFFCPTAKFRMIKLLLESVAITR